MSRFNLIDEKWIPVRFPDGSRDELGIRDTLIRSKEIEAIEDPSPLVTAALHRFLLAVLYRALEGPTDIQQAKDLFKTGLPTEKITSYLEKWRDRFWLFNEKYPFGQNPNVPQTSAGAWNRLTVEYNPTKNKVLFDHTNLKNLGECSYQRCARWLISTMNFSISGGRGYYPSPSSNAMMCIPLGQDLWRTLSYNLVPYSNRETMKADSALWERETKSLPLEKRKRVPVGYADVYTWQPRMVLIEESPSLQVFSVRFVAGEGFDNTSRMQDLMQPYRIDKKFGILPVPFKGDRGTWRDFDSLLPDTEGNAPATIQNAVRLAGHRVENLPKSILVLGLRYQPPNADLDFWRMESYELPQAIASDRSIRVEIKQLLSEAEETQKALWKACAFFARNQLSRGERNPDSKDIRQFVEQMPVNSWYWAYLESRFHDILHHYTPEVDFEDIRAQWLRCLWNTLRTAWDKHRLSASTGDAWTIRALVKAEGIVSLKLKELNEEIMKLEPQKEEA